jgi:hypothetical protein
MSMRRFVQILPCLWALTSACGSDLTDGNGTPEPDTGALELTVSTTGHDLDPNGYTLVVDDARVPGPARQDVVRGRIRAG